MANLLLCLVQNRVFSSSMFFPQNCLLIFPRQSVPLKLRILPLLFYSLFRLRIVYRIYKIFQNTGHVIKIFELASI